MNKTVQQLYDVLPARLRSVPASLYGYYLRSWRYGPETERLVEEALKREHWTADQWRCWRAERLVCVLQRAATRVPYYRAQWEARRRQGDRASWDQLENWPILEKEQVRQNARSFLADDCDPRKLFQNRTSGTTGTPLRLWQSRETLRNWYALFEARWRRWYGVSRRDRWAILGGQMVVPYRQTRPPFWVWNAALRQLYLSAHHLSPDFIPHYLQALRQYRITYLWGYTSALHALAEEATRLGRDDLRMKVVIANAEPVFEHQRTTIAAAFQCPVRETYGQTEMVAAAAECEAGHLHLWPEAGIVEVLENGITVPAGSPGDLVVTGLVNADMPLIRYRLGDTGVLPSSGTTCPCGRLLPVLKSVLGRSEDVFQTPDGRRLYYMDNIFKFDLPVHEAQIIQETLQHIRVRYVPAQGFAPKHEQHIIKQVQTRMGKVQVVLEKVSRVPRSANGKFRAYISKLAPPRSKSGNTFVSGAGHRPHDVTRTVPDGRGTPSSTEAPDSVNR